MKRILIILGLLAATPLFASAQTPVTASSTDAQIFTACSQTAIEVRDEAIGSARAAYNNAMALALDARKEAEKKAVALEDEGDKKAAIKEAVEDYKQAVTQAQDSLLKARKEAWGSFEANTKACRDIHKEKHEMLASEKSGNATSSKPVTKNQEKTFKETLIDSLKNFFKLKAE